MTRFPRVLLVLALLTGLVAGLDARLDQLLPLNFQAPISAQRVSAAPARLMEAADQEISTAIQQVIQRSNDEQVQAIAARDPSLMADTVTSEHYTELVQINQDLIDHAVTSIQLINLEWGAIAIDGSTATATTYETWTSVYSDGSVARSRDRNDYSLVLDNGTWKIKSDTHPGQAPPSNPAPPRIQPFPGVPDNQNTSHNWSGYAATGGTYTAVSGTWSVPSFNSSDGAFGIDAAWVGIGGVRDRDLIQAGTQETVSGNGRTRYEAWVETLPQSSRPVPLRIHPGDSISVAITEQSINNWLIEFTNTTTGQTYQEAQQYRSTHSSAEWVEEAPSGGRGGVLPLSNFGSVEFSHASAVKNGQTVNIADAGARPITMISADEQALAVPSPLGSDGASFTVARTAAPATTAGPRGSGFLPPVPLDGTGS